MKVGLSVFELSTSSINKNMRQVMADVSEMKGNGSDLAVFPETCLTGLFNRGDYDSDIHLAITTEDSFFKELSRLSYELEISVSIGFLEKWEGLLFAEASYSRRLSHTSIGCT
jgi:predicted amidohydrolase